MGKSVTLPCCLNHTLSFFAGVPPSGPISPGNRSVVEWWTLTVFVLLGLVGSLQYPVSCLPFVSTHEPSSASQTHINLLTAQSSDSGALCSWIHVFT